MVDLISRQAAIDMIDAIFPVDSMKTEYTQGIACGAALAKTYIKQLPSAQSETHDKRTETHACDLINRQQAIDALKSQLSDWNDDYNIPVRKSIENIERLPPAQPHWIPCSKGLPEDNVPVNITWINRKPELYYAEIKDVPFTATGVYFKGKWYWYSSTVEDYLAEYGRAEWDEIEEAMHNSIEVVAWMPLPKPYGGESE